MLERQPSPNLSGITFDPWLTCSQPDVEALGDRILSDWSVSIDRERARALKAADQQNRETILRTILANLALSIVLTGGSGTILPSLGVGLRSFKQPTTRYDRPGFRGLPAVLDLMAETGSLTIHRSKTIGQVSRIVPSASVIAGLSRCEPTWCNFSQQAGRETIILTCKDGDDDEEHWPPRRAEWMDYRDTATSCLFRCEMERINAFLATAEMCFVDDGGLPVATHARSLRRYFRHICGKAGSRHPRFDLGGRLFGGGSTPAWWSDLAKVRRKGIRLQGEPVADLDFASMFLRLAYIEAGRTPPDGDLYDGLSGLSEARWRPGIKKVASAMLFRSTPLTRRPAGSAEQLPRDITGRDLRAAIRARHPPLVDVFEMGVGMLLMFVESQVLVAAMLRLVDAGIVALPMHDGLMVARSQATRAEGIMHEASRAVTGHALPISLKAIS